MRPSSRGLSEAINRWENGRAKPSPLALKQIEELLRSLGDRGQDLLREFVAGEEN
ncbi:MAG: hypothetical protein WAL90_16845 [Desulfobacterales bacterium]